jgi:hypothetical protein
MWIYCLTVDVVDTDVEILPEGGEMREALARAILPVRYSCGATTAAYTHVLGAGRSCSKITLLLSTQLLHNCRVVGKGLWEAGA